MSQPRLSAIPLPARLRRHTEQWRSEIQDPWTLGIITHGLQPTFRRQPPRRQRHQPRWRRPSCQAEALHIRTHLDQFLSNGVIRVVGRSTPQLRSQSWLSRLFLVPKTGAPEGRPCLNVKPLNKFIHSEKFKMETLKDLRSILRRHDWLTKVDLRQAYHHIPLHRRYRRFLRFEVAGVIYEFRSLPFGPTEGPRIFTLIMRRLAERFRLQGIRCLFYLDDILIVGRSRAECLRNTRITIEFLTSLGFELSQKSVLRPNQALEYLGFVIDTNQFSFVLTNAKRRSFRHRVVRLLNAQEQQRAIRLRDLSSVLGTLNSLSIAFLQTNENLTSLKDDLRHWTRQHANQYDLHIRLSPRSIMQLKTWHQLLSTTLGRPIRLDAPQLVIDTDACPQGWGAIIRSPQFRCRATRGFWTQRERELHNNYLELQGAVLGLMALTPDDMGPLNILARTDNTTGCSYINRRAGRLQAFNKIVAKLWTWADRRGHSIRASFLPGRCNILADGLSRAKLTFCEGLLDPAIFQAIVRRWFRPSIDLFAARHCHQLPRYVSRHPDHQAVATDAFTLDWMRLDRVYLNPPFALLGSVLRRLEESLMPQAILIVPLWPSAPWWPLLWQLIIAWPQIVLPYPGVVLLPYHGRGRSPAPRWPLLALQLSGDRRRSRSWMQRLENSSCRFIEQRLRVHMMGSGLSSATGWQSVAERAIRRISSSLTSQILR